MPLYFKYYNMNCEVIKPFGKQKLGDVISLSKDLAERNIKLKRVKETTKKIKGQMAEEEIKEQKDLFDSRLVELNKYPEFQHKLELSTTDAKFKKIVENLDKWKKDNNK